MMPQEREPAGGVGQTIIGDTAARERVTGTILHLADRADRYEAAIQERIEPVLMTAQFMLDSGDRATAARLFEWIAAQFRGRSFGAKAEDYERQARECLRRTR